MRGETPLALPLHAVAADPVHQAEAYEAWSEVVEAIHALTEEQRQVIAGRLILGYDVEMLGRMLGKKGDAINALPFRAQHSLHRLLRMQASPQQAVLSRMRRQGGAS